MGHAKRVDALRAAWEPIQARLRALDTALWERANALASGLGHGRNVWHNAMLARDTGQPWPEVDYDRLRRAIHVDTVIRGRVHDLDRRLWRALYERHVAT